MDMSRRGAARVPSLHSAASAQNLRDHSPRDTRRAGRVIALMRCMYRTCIAVVDASRARLFTYERSSEAEGIEETFVEQRDFVHPARRLTAAEQLSDSPGSSRMGGNHFGFDDHREARIDALDAEFARMVNREIAQLVLAMPAIKLILCASPRMLGHLRDSRSELPRDLSIEELARDLVKLTPTELRDHLASRGLVPVRTVHPRTA